MSTIDRTAPDGADDRVLSARQDLNLRPADDFDVEASVAWARIADVVENVLRDLTPGSPHRGRFLRLRSTAHAEAGPPTRALEVLR